MNIEEIIEELNSYGTITLEECGCSVEADGTCPCGNESPLLAMGMI